MNARRTALATACAIVVAPASADVINVPGDQPTIAAALGVAVPGDEIIVASGTYDISAGLVFASSNVTLVSASGDPLSTILDCNGGENVISIGSVFGILIKGFTITDGDEPLSLFNAEVEIRGCRVAGNTSVGNFGALSAIACELRLIDCVFEDNVQSTPTAGAAVAVFGGDLTVLDSRFSNNTAPSGDPLAEISQGSAIIAGAGSAGGPLQTSAIVITNTLFEGNVADNGGAISTLGADVTIDRCDFIDNTGTFGGAYFGGQFPLQDGIATGFLTVTNSVFSGNDAPSLMGFNGVGGALAFSQQTQLKAINNTFYANTAENSRTIHLSSETTGTIANNIFADTAQPPFNSAPVSDTHNLDTTAAGAGLVDADGADNVPGTGDDDLRLAPGSPAIDAGSNPEVPAGVVLDHASLDRFVDDPDTPDTGIGDVLPVVDIGAHEFQPSAGPCNAADLAQPFGQLDFSDVVAFLTAFGASQPGADLAPPFGQWDFSDVVAFLSAFGAGCP